MTVSLTPPDADDDRGAWSEVEDPGQNPRDTTLNRETAGRLAAAIGALPRQQGIAFQLHHLDGCSLEDVAHIMGCRVGTVKAHVFRACERLRLEMEPYLNGSLT